MEYEVVSGQKVNFEKSLVYFGAFMTEVEINIVTTDLGVRVSTNSKKYLGLPMMVDRQKSRAFVSFVDRFHAKVEGWSSRYLSMRVKKCSLK